jgi:regulator of protease activity HflC (stomatin/prohibitin superfamily)
VAAAAERARADEGARVRAEAEAEAADARREGAALSREVSALEARVGRGEYNPSVELGSYYAPATSFITVYYSINPFIESRCAFR